MMYSIIKGIINANIFFVNNPLQSQYKQLSKFDKTLFVMMCCKVLLLKFT